MKVYPWWMHKTVVATARHSSNWTTTLSRWAQQQQRPLIPELTTNSRGAGGALLELTLISLRTHNTLSSRSSALLSRLDSSRIRSRAFLVNPISEKSLESERDGKVFVRCPAAHDSLIPPLNYHHQSLKKNSLRLFSVGETADASKSMEGDLKQNSSPMRRTFQVVVAATRKNGIGKDGKLPWCIPSEMKIFKKLTSETDFPDKQNAVVMGRNTWLSLPPKFRPLPGRLNVVLSRTLSSEEVSTGGTNVLVSKTLDEALKLFSNPQYTATIETVYVIGGGQIYREAMTSPLCDAIHFTEIENAFDCDTFCPEVDRSAFAVWASPSPILDGVRYSFVTYVRKTGCKEHVTGQQNGTGFEAAANPPEKGRLVKFIMQRHEEYQYLRLIKEIIETGNVKGDRTGTGTISKFGCQMRFNLRKSFPLLTTKRVHWRGIVEELLWFISGSTKAKVLQDKGIRIWDGNSSKEYLDSLGLTEREDGDLGPIYGFQWRHFGAKYTNMHADYAGQGFDQLADVIHRIRTNPGDRRIMLSAWNPADLHLMALPPCHMFAQFYVANGELSCQMYQRSCDMGLGVPYNIASYSLLTCIIAHVCDLVPGDFVHVLGDAHVYKNHVEPLQSQLKNTPKPFPILRIKSSAGRAIDSFTADDFELLGYESSKRIAMKMAV